MANNGVEEFKKICAPYDALCEEIITNDEVITDYEKGLHFKKSLLEVVTLNVRGLKALMHPIRLKRTYDELGRLEDIKFRYNEIRNSSLLENEFETTGDVEEDLGFAARVFKPDRIRWFIKENPVFDEEIDKKLIKIR